VMGGIFPIFQSFNCDLYSARARVLLARRTYYAPKPSVRARAVDALKRRGQAYSQEGQLRPWKKRRRSFRA
jgi:hypothetical protein